MTHTPSTRSILRYFGTMAAVAMVLLMAVAIFNALVDPFNMYQQLSQPGFNSVKPAVYARMRLYKAFEVARVKPQTLILGTSRTHVGLRCSHEALATMEKPCYNLAFDGATTKELYYYLRHAQAIRPLKHVILGIDSYQATNATNFTRPDFDPLLLYNPDWPGVFHFITADLRLLTSLDTLRASIQTIRGQNTVQPRWFASDGQRLGDIYFRQVMQDRFTLSPRAYFEQIDHQEIVSQLAGLTAPAAKHPTPAAPDESSFSYIRRIIAFCRSNNIDLRMFITPAHAHQTEISSALWGWPSIEYAKRQLVLLLTEDAMQHPTLPPIHLMDFSGYSSVTTENLPPVGSVQEMQYYWESSHFKQIVGDYILDRLFGYSTPARATPSDFGVFLNSDTLETVLESQRKARAEYRKNFPKDLDNIRSQIPMLPIIVYHEVLAPGQHVREWSTQILQSDFEAQMKYLHDQGYQTLNMDEVVQFMQGKPFPPKVVAVHFDDGWETILNALPILEKYHIKTTFWIIGGMEDVNPSYLSWQQLGDIAKNPLFDIQSHTMTHPWRDGDTLVDWLDGHTPGKGPEQAQWELTESKHVLEQFLHHPIPYLAWPRGIYNDTLIRMAQKAGYTATLSIDDGANLPGGDLLRIHRTMIDGECTMDDFKQVVFDGQSRDCPEVTY